MKYLTLYQVAVSSAEDLHLSDTQEYAWFMRKAQNAARRLKSWEGLKPKECCVVTDNEGVACVPCDFYRVLAIQVFPTPSPNQNNPVVTGHLSPIYRPGGLLYYMDAPALNRCGINTGGWAGSSRAFTLDGDKLGLYGYRNCPVNICYMAYNMNEQGQMNIKDEWEEYIIKYVCAEYCLAFPNLKPQWVYMEYKKEWQAIFRGIRSDETEKQMQNDKAQISLLMNNYVGRSNLRIFN